MKIKNHESAWIGGISLGTLMLILLSAVFV